MVLLDGPAYSSTTILSQVDNASDYLSTSVAVNIDPILPSNWIATVMSNLCMCGSGVCSVIFCLADVILFPSIRLLHSVMVPT